MPTERSFQPLRDVKLDRVYRIMIYLSTALLSTAYLVFIVICDIEKHSMSSYLILSLFLIFIISAIPILPQIKNIKNNN
jgi:hypothetical protein